MATTARDAGSDVFMHAKLGCRMISRHTPNDVRVISRNSEHHWPPYSPDLTCLDFSFWPQAQEQVVRQKPQTSSHLKSIVEEFARSISEEQLRRMARHSRRRTDLCQGRIQDFHWGGAAGPGSAILANEGAPFP